jgi:FMN phosphatase YigB (HAD superfamily)
MIKRVYLDLDRTLLNTDELVDRLFTACQKLYGLSQQTLRAEIPDFYFSAGSLRHYDMFAQLEAHGVGYEHARYELAKELAGQDFAMSGLTELLHFLAARHLEMHVVSFGKTDYQMFKYHMLPQIRHLPITVIFEDKDVWLEKQSTLPSALIDDKRTWPLPTWCVQLLLDPKAGDEPVQESAQLWTVNSLSSAISVLTKL